MALRFLVLTVVTIVLGGCIKESGNLKLTRRPYLQNVWADSASVIWKTNVPGDNCQIMYCINQVNQIKPGKTIKNPDGSYTNMVTLTGLQAGQRYKYSIYNGNIMLDNSELNFIDVTKTDTTIGFNFLSFGDIGRNPYDDGFPQITASRILSLPLHPDFIIGLGDIVYPLGESSKYDENLFMPLAYVFSNIPFYPVLGNHDWGVNPDENFCREWKLPNNEHYYSYNYQNVHFINLDSKSGDFYNYAEQKAWLINDLQQAQGQYDFIVVNLHHPGRSCTYKSNEPNVIALYPIFAQYNVDIVMNGHAHTYERLHPYNADGNVIDQYRTDINNYPDIVNGYISITAGAGGLLEDWTPGECEGDRVAKRYLQGGSFMQYTVKGKKLEAKIYDIQNGNVVDQFVIQK
jgi:3',5'-cyclic AMP phosphodiesterase CpdA